MEETEENVRPLSNLIPDETPNLLSTTSIVKKEARLREIATQPNPVPIWRNEYHQQINAMQSETSTQSKVFMFALHHNMPCYSQSQPLPETTVSRENSQASEYSMELPLIDLEAEDIAEFPVRLHASKNLCDSELDLSYSTDYESEMEKTIKSHSEFDKPVHFCATLFINTSMPADASTTPHPELRNDMNSSINPDNEMFPHFSCMLINNNAPSISTAVPNFCAMLSSNQREMPMFNGNPDQDLLGWIEQFENAFNVSRHNCHQDSKSKNEAMAHCLR